MKRVINEEKLNYIIVESIKRKLNEMESLNLTFKEFCDLWKKYKMPIDFNDKQDIGYIESAYECWYEEWLDLPEDEKEEIQFRDYAENNIYHTAKEFHTDPDNLDADEDFCKEMGWWDK